MGPADQAIESTELKFDITMPKIRALEVSGTSAATLDEGSAEELTLELSGMSKVDAQKYQVKNVAVEISGASGAKVWATEALTGSVSGTGNVAYKGEPKTVDVEVSGIGSVDPL